MEVFLYLLVLFFVILIFKGFRVVQQSEIMVLERLGSYSRTISSGLNMIVPFLDRPRDMFWITDSGIRKTIRIDMRETVLDVPEQAVITKDNVAISIDALMYVQIVDPVKACYEIAHLPLAMSQLAQTSLRNVIGELDLDDTLASRDLINGKLKQILDDATDKWGTKVNRVELRNISPPAEIQNSMEKQMQAERERRAKVLEAEGDKQARISRSEGQRQEQINIAEGDKESAVRRAEGEANAIRLVAEAKKQAIAEISMAIGRPELATQFLIATDYLDKFGKFEAHAANKVFIPYEASTALGALGTIKEILKER